MIRVLYSPGKLWLRGHAGAAPRGYDPICGAVSILVETLARSLPPDSSRLGAGKARFQFPRESPEARFALRGLQLLAQTYPQYVRLDRMPDPAELELP